mmetsp:Transcript_18646/g.47911  ORF Transcript_18646/g.47911 Transcript_18646/m.47911 type:complete len:232 (+) Transcript_18646:1402-2097(+)
MYLGPALELTCISSMAPPGAHRPIAFEEAYITAFLISDLSAYGACRTKPESGRQPGPKPRASSSSLHFPFSVTFRSAATEYWCLSKCALDVPCSRILQRPSHGAPSTCGQNNVALKGTPSPSRAIVRWARCQPSLMAGSVLLPTSSLSIGSTTGGSFGSLPVSLPVLLPWDRRLVCCMPLEAAADDDARSAAGGRASSGAGDIGSADIDAPRGPGRSGGKKRRGAHGGALP